MSESRKSQLDPEAKPDDRVDNALRPQKLAELIGQDQVKANLGQQFILAYQTDGTYLRRKSQDKLPRRA